MKSNSKESQTFYSLTAAQIDKHDRGNSATPLSSPAAISLVHTHTHTHTDTGNRAPPNVLKTLQFCSVVKFNFLVEFMRKLQKSYSNCLASHQRYGQCKKGVPQSKGVRLRGGRRGEEGPVSYDLDCSET